MSAINLREAVKDSLRTIEFTIQKGVVLKLTDEMLEAGADQIHQLYLDAIPESNDHKSMTRLAQDVLNGKVLGEDRDIFYMKVGHDLAVKQTRTNMEGKVE